MADGRCDRSTTRLSARFGRRPVLARDRRNRHLSATRLRNTAGLVLWTKRLSLRGARGTRCRIHTPCERTPTAGGRGQRTSRCSWVCAGGLRASQAADHDEGSPTTMSDPGWRMPKDRARFSTAAATSLDSGSSAFARSIPSAQGTAMSILREHETAGTVDATRRVPRDRGRLVARTSNRWRNRRGARDDPRGIMAELQTCRTSRIIAPTQAGSHATMANLRVVPQVPRPAGRQTRTPAGQTSDRCARMPFSPLEPHRALEPASVQWWGPPRLPRRPTSRLDKEGRRQDAGGWWAPHSPCSVLSIQSRPHHRKLRVLLK